MASHGRKETVLISENSLPDGGRLKDDNHMNWEAKMEQLQEEWVDMVNHNRKFMYRGLDGKWFDINSEHVLFVLFSVESV